MDQGKGDDADDEKEDDRLKYAAGGVDGHVVLLSRVSR
jgi:hypothetical protein